MTTCLPCSIAIRSKSAATPGLPVASITTSTSGLVTSNSLEVMASFFASIAAVSAEAVSASIAAAVVAIGDRHRVARRVRPARRHRDQFDALHQHALGDQIGAHLARADDADAHRLAFVGTPGEIACKAGEGDVGHREKPAVMIAAQLAAPLSPWQPSTGGVARMDRAAKQRSARNALAPSNRLMDGIFPGSHGGNHEQHYLYRRPCGHRAGNSVVLRHALSIGRPPRRRFDMRKSQPAGRKSCGPLCANIGGSSVGPSGHERPDD